MWLAAYKGRSCLHITVSALSLQLSRNKWLCTCLQTLTLQSREACSTRVASATASMNSCKSTKGVDVCDAITIMPVNVFLLGMQPKEAFVCLHKVVNPSLHALSTELIFSKQGNKKQILLIYLSILAFWHEDQIKKLVLPKHSNKLSKKSIQCWIPKEKVWIFCAT